MMAQISKKPTTTRSVRMSHGEAQVRANAANEAQEKKLRQLSASGELNLKDFERYRQWNARWGKWMTRAVLVLTVPLAVAGAVIVVSGLSTGVVSTFTKYQTTVVVVGSQPLAYWLSICAYATCSVLFFLWSLHLIARTQPSYSRSANAKTVKKKCFKQ